LIDCKEFSNAFSFFTKAILNYDRKQPICPQLINNKGTLTSKIDKDFDKGSLSDFIREKPSSNRILQRSQGSSSQRELILRSQHYDTTNDDEEEDDYEDDNGSLKYDEVIFICICYMLTLNLPSYFY
jgi:hypothetical protein